MSETPLPAKIRNTLSQNWWAPPSSARYVIIEWSLECLLKKAYTIPSSAHHLLLDPFFPFLLLATNLLKTLSRGPPPPFLCFCYLWSVLFFLFSVPLPLHSFNPPVPSSFHYFSSPFILCSDFLSLRSSLAPLRCFFDVPPIVPSLSRSILFAPLLCPLPFRSVSLWPFLVAPLRWDHLIIYVMLKG